jgi:hypothetical protein
MFPFFLSRKRTNFQHQIRAIIIVIVIITFTKKCMHKKKKPLSFLHPFFTAATQINRFDGWAETDLCQIIYAHNTQKGKSACFS